MQVSLQNKLRLALIFDTKECFLSTKILREKLEHRAAAQLLVSTVEFAVVAVVVKSALWL